MKSISTQKMMSIFLIGIVIVAVLVPGPKVDVVENMRVPYGAYGLAFTTMPAKSAKKRVILIGNSVHQREYHVTERLIELGRAANIEIANFALTGSSVFDYLFIYNYVRQFKPDLVVFTFSALSVGLDYPIQRTLAPQMIFQPANWRLLRHEWIVEQYRKDDICLNLLYALFPLLRAQQIAASTIKHSLNLAAFDFTGMYLLRFFPHDINFNRAGEWAAAGKPGAAMKELIVEGTEEYRISEPSIRLLTELLRADEQRAIFIKQEDAYAEAAVLKKLPELTANAGSLVTVYDHRPFYRKERFRDEIHPTEEEAPFVAQRLFDAISETLVR